MIRHITFIFLKKNRPIMIKSNNIGLFTFIILLFATSCLKDDTSTLPEPVKRPVNISDPTEFNDEIITLNDLTEEGDDYDANMADTNLRIFDYQDQVTTSNGGVVYIPFYTNKSFEKLSVQVVGNQTVIDQTFTRNNITGKVFFSYNMPIQLSGPGSIYIKYWVTDSVGRLSNVVKTEIKVIILGQGLLQVSFSWDNTSDLDIWLFEPSGEKIYYIDRTSRTGGILDRDDVDGFGPENIYWPNKPPEGKYQVNAHLYSNHSGSENTNYSIIINFRDYSRTFRGTLSPSNRLDTVAIFNIEGTNIEFQE
jgi:phage pi2 protein 07